jgi:hypothetical protein
MRDDGDLSALAARLPLEGWLAAHAQVGAPADAPGGAPAH